MVFQFKTFSVKNEKSSMKVNTDSVLLGAWTQITENTKTALDIGSGTGLLTLMLAHKNKDILIDAIEIEENAFVESKDNFENSNWNNRLTPFHISLQKFTPTRKYDLIITNPPYFLNSLKNELKNKSLARHTDSLSFEEIIEFCIQNLTSKGKLFLILPKEESDIFIEKSTTKNLFLNKKCTIKPNSNKPINRVLMEFSLTKTKVILEKMEIYKAQNVYSDKHFELTKEFYLDK